MTEVFEHNPGDHEDPLTGPTWIIGFLGAVLLAVIMLGLTALTYNAQEEEEQKKVVERDPEELERIRTSQLAKLTAAPRYVEEWVKATENGREVDKLDKALVIPIDRAMELVVHEAGKAPQ